MSIQRTPNNGVMCAITILATFGVLVLAWLLTNVIDAMDHIWTALQGAW